MGRWDRNGAKSVFWKWACFLFIENSFIMPVTLLHQWEDRDNTMTKNPNAGENFEADLMNDLSFPVSFLISWVKTRHKLAHRLGARFVCVCSVERTAAFLFHIGCRVTICSCGCERWKRCRKISKWTVALILFAEWFPERKQGIFFQKMNDLLRKYWYYRASYKYMLNFVKRNKKLPHTQEEPEKNEWLIGETQNKKKSLHLFLNLNFDTSGTHTFKKKIPFLSYSRSVVSWNMSFLLQNYPFGNTITSHFLFHIC